MKDGHDVSGTNRDNWEFFDVMDQVLGSRHFVDPPTTIDTSRSGHVMSQSTDVDANCISIQHVMYCGVFFFLSRQKQHSLENVD